MIFIVDLKCKLSLEKLVMILVISWDLKNINCKGKMNIIAVVVAMMVMEMVMVMVDENAEGK